MTGTEIAAFAGAAAWVPQIATWAYNVWARPVVRITPAATVSIGYTQFGPVVTFTSSLSAERKSALIEKIRLRVTHAKGDERRLVWTLLSDFQHQIHGPAGEVINFGRSQAATAIKLAVDSLSDRVIFFQDLDFQEAARKITERVLDQMKYLRTSGSATILADLMRSKEVRAAREFFERNFYWKEGSYVFDVSIEVAGVKQPQQHIFTVELSTQEADDVKSNLQLFDTYVASSPLLGTGQAPTIQWKWANVKIQRVRG